MRVYHVALVSDWEAAQRTGLYTTSTRGVSLEQEGFVHASREDQWEGVRARFYGDVEEPLVLLVVDTDLLGSPVVEEVPAGASETFPHVYGPLEAAAVIEARPLPR
jgi:glutathione S-transferase